MHQLDPPRGEQTVDLVLVADVVAVLRREYLALVDRAAVDRIVRERCGEVFEPLGERLARILHAFIDGRKTAAPRRRRGYGAARLRTPFEPVESSDDRKQREAYDADRRERRQQMRGGRGVVAAGNPCRSLDHGTHRVLRQQTYRQDQRRGYGHSGKTQRIDLGGLRDMRRARRAQKDDAVEFGKGQNDDASDQRQRH